MTATWDTFFVDYQVNGPIPGVPAHVVAQKALGIQDPAEAEAALVKAIQDKDTAKLKPIADAWNTYFDATSLPSDPGIYSSYGPYDLTAFTDDGTDDVRGQPGLQVGSAAEREDHRLLDHR